MVEYYDLPPTTALLRVEIAICNTQELLYSTTVSSGNSTNYVIQWNGTQYQSKPGESYCVALISQFISISAIPVLVQFDFFESDIVPNYCSIQIPEAVIFETEYLVMFANLRDQWNNSVESIIEVYDYEGNQVATSNLNGQILYNATVKSGGMFSKVTLYLFDANRVYPHTTFYGKHIVL